MAPGRYKFNQLETRSYASISCDMKDLHQIVLAGTCSQEFADISAYLLALLFGITYKLSHIAKVEHCSSFFKPPLPPESGNAGCVTILQNIYTNFRNNQPFIN